MAQAVESQSHVLRILPYPRQLEGGFHSGVYHPSNRVASFLQRHRERWIRQEKIGDEWVGIRSENSFAQVTRLIVVRSAKTDPWHHGEPPEISVRIEKLMEGINAQRGVILKTGTAGE